MKIPAWDAWNQVVQEPEHLMRNQLFRELVVSYAQAHGFCAHARYVVGSRMETDLPHMAAFLRQQGWSCYFYRDSATQGSRPLGFAEWGLRTFHYRHMGLMIGAHCGRWLEWRIINWNLP